MGDDDDARTLFCANLSDSVTESILYELFMQGGPVERVSMPKDKDGRPRNFGFITYVHAVSIPYALTLFAGTQLFNREIRIKSRNNTNQLPLPALDTNRGNHHNYQPQRQSNYQRNNQADFEKMLQQHRQQQQHFQKDTSSLRSGIVNNLPTLNTMIPITLNFGNSTKNILQNQFADINSLISMGQNMLGSGRSQMKADSTSSNYKMLNRHDNRPHRNNDRQPYARNAPPPRQRSLSRDREIRNDRGGNQRHHNDDRRSSFKDRNNRRRR